MVACYNNRAVRVRAVALVIIALVDPDVVTVALPRRCDDLIANRADKRRRAVVIVYIGMGVRHDKSAIEAGL